MGCPLYPFLLQSIPFSKYLIASGTFFSSRHSVEILRYIALALEKYSTITKITKTNTLVLMMLRINISDFLILFSELHIVIIKLIVVDNLVDLFNPFVVHEHLVVTVGDGFLSGYELLVLRLEFVS